MLIFLIIEIGRIHSVWDDGSKNDTSILIAWQLNCADEDIIHGYNISYCALSNSTKCIQSHQYKIIILADRNNIYKYRLTSLRPYTQYNISVAMISVINRMGPFSNSIIVQTMEGSKFIIINSIYFT